MATLRGNILTSLGSKEAATGTPSMHDLGVAYFTSGKLSQSDGIRAFLQFQTGLTTMVSISDLWRQYFLGKGIQNKVSLTDMANDYFTTQVLP